MVVEIGTSDFRTLAGQKEGLYIEPVKEYFDRLPKCNKENVAISNYEGSIDIFYIPLKVIEQNNLPNWVRGCNSVGEIHPTINRLNYDKYVVKETVQVVRIKTLIKKHNIKEISLLKVDTEGHDCIILNDFLNTVSIFPKIIQFENNELSDKKEVQKLVNRLELMGYDCKQVKFDIIARL